MTEVNSGDLAELCAATLASLDAKAKEHGVKHWSMLDASVFAEQIQQYEQASRILACWNACRGIPTEALNDGVLREFVWGALLEINWSDCKPRSGMFPDPNAEPHKGAEILKKHGGSWEQFT